MWWKLFVVMYILMGLTISAKHKSKERLLIDKIGDYLYVTLAWFPVWAIAYGYYLKEKLVEWWDY